MLGVGNRMNSSQGEPAPDFDPLGQDAGVGTGHVDQHGIHRRHLGRIVDHLDQGIELEPFDSVISETIRIAWA